MNNDIAKVKISIVKFLNVRAGSRPACTARAVMLRRSYAKSNEAAHQPSHESLRWQPGAILTTLTHV